MRIEGFFVHVDINKIKILKLSLFTMKFLFWVKGLNMKNFLDLIKIN